MPHSANAASAPDAGLGAIEHAELESFFSFLSELARPCQHHVQARIRYVVAYVSDPARAGESETGRSGICGKVEREIAARNQAALGGSTWHNRLRTIAAAPSTLRRAICENPVSDGLPGNEHKAKARKSQASFCDDLERLSRESELISSVRSLWLTNLTATGRCAGFHLLPLRLGCDRTKKS